LQSQSQPPQSSNEEKQEQKTLSIGELLHIANGIEENLNKEHHLSSSEIMFIGTILQASATTDYMIHTLIKNAHVQVLEIRPDRPPFKPGEN
jgi:hypothetical protein